MEKNNLHEKSHPVGFIGEPMGLGGGVHGVILNSLFPMGSVLST